MSELEVYCPDHKVRLRPRESKFGPFLGCPEWPACSVTAALHPDGSLKSTPADKETKEARRQAHFALDHYWQGEKTKRERRDRRVAVYRWLRETLRIPADDCHIGFFDRETCEHVVFICSDRERVNAEIESMN